MAEPIPPAITSLVIQVRFMALSPFAKGRFLSGSYAMDYARD